MSNLDLSSTRHWSQLLAVSLTRLGDLTHDIYVFSGTWRFLRDDSKTEICHRLL